MRYLLLILVGVASVAMAEPRGAEYLGEVAVDDVDALALRTEIVTPATVDKAAGEQPLAEGQRRAIVHMRPVWHVTDAGRLAPVSTSVEGAIEDLKAVWRADNNTIRFRVTEDGVCVYRVGTHVLRVWPLRSSAEAADGSGLSGVDQVKPSETTAEKDNVVQAGSFVGIRFEHRVEPGSVKETAWLDGAPQGIGTARFYVLSYRWDSDTLTPTISGGEVLWRTADGQTILRWPAPVVTDAAGKELRASYRTRLALPNVVGIQVNATDLRAATYPVGIDPTTTTGLGDSFVGRSTRQTSVLQYKGAYLKITLPSMSGNTVTDATIQVNVANNAGPMNNINVYARAVADTGAYDNSSTYSTLDALSLGTAISTGNTLSAGTGNKTFNIFGDATKGVSQFYSSYPTGGDICVAFIWSAFAATLNIATANLKIGDEDAFTRFAQFAAYNDATNYPRITITYTAAATANGNFFLLFR